MDKKYCRGCYNERYNHGAGGSDECWMLKSAKVVWRKRVHVDQVPPWEQKAERVPDCYRIPRYVFVGANQEC